MPDFLTTRLLITGLLCLALSGCGFKLAGTKSLPPELGQIYLVTSDFSEQQRSALSQRLTQAGAQVSRQPVAQAVQLRASLKSLPDRRLVTSASNGKTVERLARSLAFSLKGADGNLLAPAKTLIQQKDIVLDDDNLLSSDVERRSVIEDLEAALFNQLIFQLKRI
jgi:LPS-assembly lipoprotein